MREASGGVFMIRLMLVFIVIYVAFGALSLNYAKAFKIKNKVISYIEENNIQEFCNEEQLANLGAILDQYDSTVECDTRKYNQSTPCQYDTNEDSTTYCYHGVRIEKMDNITNKDKLINITNYKVSTFASWNLTFMNNILVLSGQSPNGADVINGSWEITGKAKVINRNKVADETETPTANSCPRSYKPCREVYDAESGNEERNVLVRVIRSEGGQLNSSCCNLTSDRADEITTSIIYNGTGDMPESTRNAVTEEVRKYCHDQNKLLTNAHYTGLSSENKVRASVTCTSINVVPPQ